MEKYKVDLPKSNFKKKEKKKVVENVILQPVKGKLTEITASYADIYGASQNISNTILYMSSKIRGNSLKLTGFLVDALVDGLSQSVSEGYIVNDEKIKRLIIKSLYQNLKDGNTSEDEVI